jgi:hypothetical protein
MFFSLSLKLNTDSIPENLEMEVINGKFSERNFKIFFSHLPRRNHLLKCSHPARQRPTTATNHTQQNQSNTPNAVTGSLIS